MGVVGKPLGQVLWTNPISLVRLAGHRTRRSVASVKKSLAGLRVKLLTTSPYAIGPKFISKIFRRPSTTTRLRESALGLMVEGRWEDAHTQWTHPDHTTITGEQRHLWHAGKTITHWISHPETLTDTLAPPTKTGNPKHVTGHTVVYSAITGNHDLSWPPGPPLPNAHYTRITDNPTTPTWNTWHNRPLEYTGGTPVRSARWAKSHPHMLFPDARWVIWLDGNVIPTGGLETLLTQFQLSGHPMAAITHPRRTTVDEEIRECITRNKDNPATLHTQHKQLGSDPGVGLWETNVCFFDLDHPNLTPLLNTWWSLIESGSHRDQISLPYAVAKTGATLHPILPPGTSTRSDPRFALIPHTHKAFTTAHTALHKLANKQKRASALNHAEAHA